MGRHRVLSRPDQKFLQDILIGLLRAGYPIVCQMARQLPNQITEYATRVNRLDEHWGNWCFLGSDNRGAKAASALCPWA